MVSGAWPSWRLKSSRGWASSACIRWSNWAVLSAAVRLGVRLDIEALGLERLDVRPRKRVAPRPDVVRVHEQGGREAQLLQHGIGVLLEGLIAVIKREHHGLPREL